MPEGAQWQNVTGRAVRRVVSVKWEAMHGGWWAMVDRRLVGEVVSYHDDAHAIYWAGYARRERVPGRYASPEGAKAAVEDALTP